jgi:energy-coupling factor transporter ATP-binding protein EcfA2
MTQRPGTAAALPGDPQVLLSGEPVNRLNPDGVRWVRNLLKDPAREGRTVFVSSHPMSEMALTANEVIIISAGRRPLSRQDPPAGAAGSASEQHGDKHSFPLKSSRHGRPVMNSKALDDPLAFMSFSERRRWRRAERRAVREHSAQQLTTLRILAATGGALTSLIYPDSGGYATSAEFMIAGTRIRAGRVHRPTLSALTQALGCTPAVALLTASRYGPYWVLTFESATAPLAVLIDELSILPGRHGGSAPLPAPTAPVDGRHRSTRIRPYLKPG